MAGMMAGMTWFIILYYFFIINIRLQLILNLQLNLE